jgi:hypothetical protein
MRLTNTVMYAAASGFVIGGVALLALPPLLGTASSRYHALATCARVSDALGPKCYAMVDVETASRGLVTGDLGQVRAMLTVKWASAVPSTVTTQITTPISEYYAIKPGQTMKMKVWNARPTAFYVPGSGGSAPRAMRTEYNPYNADDLRLVGGVSLLGVGLLVVAVNPPAPVRRALTRSWSANRPRRWQPGPGLAAYTVHDRQLRVAFGVFIAFQLLDIATSVHGGQVGLFEGNPVAAAVLDRVGPGLGFTLLKIPAIIAVLLVIARLPRLVALLVAWVGSIAFLLVVLSNLQLIWFSSAGT